MYPNVRNKKDCLHCGNETADYCEKCYQDLISENARLQWVETHNKKEFERLINKLRKDIDEQEEYIKDLEHIRDCYYNEIAARYRRTQNI